MFLVNLDTLNPNMMYARLWVFFSRDDLVDALCCHFDAITLSTSHHIIGKSQAAFFRSCKESLSEDSVFIVLYFTENYSVIVQDSVQGFYRENSQTNLHPIDVYHMKDWELCCVSLCAVILAVHHDTHAVHIFLKAVWKHLKTSFSIVLQWLGC